MHSKQRPTNLENAWIRISAWFAATQCSRLRNSIVDKSLPGKMVIVLLAVSVLSSGVGCSSGKPPTVVEATAALNALQLLSDVMAQIERGNLENDVESVKTAMRSAEDQLQHVDADLSAQLGTLRLELDSKIDRADVEVIVRRIIAELDHDLSGVERHASTARATLDHLKQLLGYIPTVKPSPLIVDTPNGQPAVNPLTKEWVELLVESEKNRIDIEQAAARFLPGTPIFDTLNVQANALLGRTERLRRTIEIDLSSRVEKRGSLTDLYALQAFDRQLGPYAWLAMVASVEHDNHPGRLAIPAALTEDIATECIHAMKLSGVSDDTLVTLYTALLPKIPRTETQESADKVDVDLQKRNYEMMLRFVSLVRQIQSLQRRMDRNQKLSPQNEEMRAMRKQQDSLIGAIEVLHHSLVTQLETSVGKYVDLLENQYRVSESRMQYFLKRDLLHLLDARNRTECRNFNDPIARETLWRDLQAVHQKFEVTPLSKELDRLRDRTTSISPDEALAVERWSVVDANSKERLDEFRGVTGKYFTEVGELVEGSDMVCQIDWSLEVAGSSREGEAKSP